MEMRRVTRNWDQTSRLVVGQDWCSANTNAATRLIRRPSRLSDNNFSGFIENAQTDTQKVFVCFTKHMVGRVVQSV
jgi:hypothetical protein